MSFKKSILLIIVSLLASCVGFAQEKQPIYSSITSYLESLVEQPIDSIIAKVDMLIAASENVDTQANIAGIAFDFFQHSPIMGQEAVSVHIADNYFLNKKLKWSDESTYPLLYTFAEFNRQSLIGMEAQELILSDMEENPIPVKIWQSEYKLLYFFDDKCATCKVQSELLTGLLKHYKGAPITLFAIYTQGDKVAWRKYVAAHFDAIDNPNVTVINAWDPEGESLYHKKYSVLSTPSMVLLNRQNIIIGRKLDCEALSQLLSTKNSFHDDCFALFDMLIGSTEGISDAEIAQIADLLYDKTKESKELFNDTFYELYQYLRANSNYEFQKGALYVAQIYVLDKSELWPTPFVEEIEYSVEMFSKNMLGQRATDLILQNKRGRDKSLLSGKDRYTLLFFHLIQCDDCQKFASQLKAIEKTLRRKRIKVIAIYVGDEEDNWRSFMKNNSKKWLYLWDKNENSNLHEKYDIQYVPKIYLLDKEKVIIAKDIDLTTLTNLINTL